MGYRFQSAGQRVVVVFEGKLTADEGVASAHAFSEALLPYDKVEAIWDLRRMTGYDRAAREAWQSTLWPLRHKIRRIVVLGGTPLVRIGATTLGLALGIPISFEDEITNRPAP